MIELPVMLFVSELEWQQWLEDNHGISQGVWLQIAKKESGKESVSYAQALDIALCFGWIDGVKNKLDHDYWVQRFTPRRKKSVWSAVNREKVNALIAAGRMRDAGLKEIENAKQDGRWERAYESQSTIKVPDDLRDALSQNEAARIFFEGLNSVNRYAILYRLQNVRKAETRQKKIVQFVQMLADGKKLHD